MQRTGLKRDEVCRRAGADDLILNCTNKGSNRAEGNVVLLEMLSQTRPDSAEFFCQRYTRMGGMFKSSTDTCAGPKMGRLRLSTRSRS